MRVNEYNGDVSTATALGPLRASLRGYVATNRGLSFA
jgi:hypothetical protein